MNELDTAIAAARAAGAVLRELWPGERQVRSKGPREIVTEADVASQTVIVERLRAAFPDHAILAEEGGALAGGAGDLCPTWVVDPLDGTTNYAHRLPAWSVGIGLLNGSDVRVGVVYDPLRDITFYAERGRGAFLVRGDSAPEPLAVSRTEQLAQAVVAVDWAHDDQVRGETLQAFGRVASFSSSVRTLGSACLGMAGVAAGWLDAYFHFALQPWDLAGASLVVAEAGGRLTTPDGQPWHMGLPRIVFSNGRLHDELLRVMGG